MTPETPNNIYLWFNISDLSAIGNIGSFGSHLNLMIKPELNDRQLSGYVTKANDLDETYIILEGTPERMNAIQDAMQLISNRKISRKIRTRLTAKPPTRVWNWHSFPTYRRVQ